MEVVCLICNFGNFFNIFYWDDCNILDDLGINLLKDGWIGCECWIEGCRIFINFDLNIFNCDRIEDDIIMGYGDKNILNIWWFVSIMVDFFVSILIVVV